MKSDLENKQEIERDTKLAKVLGLTYNEISQTEYEIDTNESNDGLIYNLIVTFKDSSPKAILSKIKGLKNNQINIDANSFE